MRYLSALSAWLNWLLSGRPTEEGVATWVCAHSSRFNTEFPHDYHKRCGGDGNPLHFHTFECPACGRCFTH